MYSVVKEVSSSVFNNIDWYKILGPLGMSFQAYLSQDEANRVCDKLNLENRISTNELAMIKSKAEQKRLQKIIDKTETQ
jgi:hypothetical protein